MTARQKEKARLLEQKKRLLLKYPKAIYNNLKLEPDDVLAHIRECVRFGARTPAELAEINFHH